MAFMWFLFEFKDSLTFRGEIYASYVPLNTDDLQESASAWRASCIDIEAGFLENFLKKEQEKCRQYACCSWKMTS